MQDGPSLHEDGSVTQVRVKRFDNFLMDWEMELIIMVSLMEGSRDF